MSDLMPKEFYDAFRKHFGFGQLTASASADAYQMLKAAEWAWQASRECLVIELPPSIGVTPIGGDGIQEFIDCNGEYLHGHLVVDAIHAAGVKTK